MSDAPEILVGWSGYLPWTPSELTFTFWLRDENDVIQKLEPRRVERDGDRYFILALPGNEVTRFHQDQSGALEWVEAIPGGDPTG